jgi:Zn-dependent peptidase ImmA (M78 family)/DNA-binding XRE family transcriptional regulator
VGNVSSQGSLREIWRCEEMEKHVLDILDPKLLGQRLQDSRKARGMTQQEVANELGIARTTVTALEKGERKIQPKEIIELAKLYGREVSDLVSGRKILGDFAVQFRASITRVGDYQTQLEKAIGDFQKFCEDYLYLERISETPLQRAYPPEYSVDGLPPEEAAEGFASAERNRLGLGDAPIINLRELLENDVGLRVFYLPLPSRIAGMFTYSDELGGCIAINSAHPEERRRWSLAHEYGHFLTGRYRPEVSILLAHERTPASERLGDGFAGAFLIPEAGLRRKFNETARLRKEKITPADLCRLANYYFVSVEALTRRLESLRLLAIGTWERLQDRGFKVREAQDLLQLQSHRYLEQELPPRYQFLAVEAYQREKLTEGQLAHYLRVDRIEARRTVQKLTRQAYVSQEGAITSLDVDFTQTYSKAGNLGVTDD